MVSALWRHGPRMLDQMKTKGLEWPRFDGAQMADLIAYLNTKQPMNKRPILVLLTSHWISMLGAALVTLAGFSWLFVLPLNIRGGGVNNPYIGLLVFIAIPIVFFAGLVLIPIGIALAKRKVAENLNEVEDRRTAWRRAGHLLRSDDGCERGDREPAQLSRRGAHGHRPVLRPDLPRHEARVHRARRHAARIRPWPAPSAISPPEPPAG